MLPNVDGPKQTLAIAADRASYLDTPGERAAFVAGWTSPTAAELGLTPGSGLTYADGLYRSGNAAALVLAGNVNGRNTVMVAFRGSDDEADWRQDLRGINQHYDLFAPLVSAIDAYAQRNGYQVIATGHSLGGAMAEIYIATHVGDAYRGYTFGAPGIQIAADTPDARLVDYRIASDPIPFLAENRADFGTALRGLSSPELEFIASLISVEIRSGLTTSELITAIPYLTSDYHLYGNEVLLEGSSTPRFSSLQSLLDLDIDDHASSRYQSDVATLADPLSDPLYAGGGTDGDDVLIGVSGSVDGGAGNDWVMLADGGVVATVTNVETLIGGSGADRVTLGTSGNTIILAAVETLEGGAGSDWVNLGDRGNTMSLSGVETLIGGANPDAITLAGSGNTVILAAIEALTGSGGGDWVNLGNRGNTMSLSGIETLIGGANPDAITLASSGNTVILAATETLTGSGGGDWVHLGNRGNTMSLSGIETLIGGANADVVTLGGDSNNLILAAVETLTGSGGGDWITLGNRGNTMTLSGIETLVGGANPDVVTLGDGGSTVILAAIETLVGSDDDDVIMLDNRGVTIVVAGVESVVGGTGNDAVTVAGGPAWFTGGGGSDRVALAAGADTVALAEPTAFLAATGFTSGTDRIAVVGTLRTILDDDGNGLVSGGTRAGGEVDLAADEIAVLSAPVATLGDAGFAAFRVALGSLHNSSAGADVLVAASGGLFLVTDNGDGIVVADEVRLVATTDTAVSLGDIRFA